MQSGVGSRMIPGVGTSKEMSRAETWLLSQYNAGNICHVSIPKNAN